MTGLALGVRGVAGWLGVRTGLERAAKSQKAMRALCGLIYGRSACF